MVEDRDFATPALSGGRGTVANSGALSSGSRRFRGSGRSGASPPGRWRRRARTRGHVELGDDGAVQFDAALARSAAAPRSSRARTQTASSGRQMHGIAVGQRRPPATSSGAWPSRTTRVKWASASLAASSPCERATIARASASFASIGSRSRNLPLEHEPVPLLELLVRDPHRAAELLLGRRGQRNVVADATSSSSRRPTRAGAASSGRPAARGRTPPSPCGPRAGCRAGRCRRARRRPRPRPSRRPASAGRAAPRPRSAPGRPSASRSRRARGSARPSSSASAQDHVREVELREPFAVEAHLGPVAVDDLEAPARRRSARSRSISSSERIGRSAERPDGSPILVV